MSLTRINDLIYLGSTSVLIDTEEKLEEFNRLNVDLIINCGSEIKFSSQLSERYIIKQYSIENGPRASLLEYLDELNDLITNSIKQKKKIYLCCDSGNSISPAILIYYFMSKHHFSYDDASRNLKRLRPKIDLNPNFINELKIIEE